MENKKRFYVYNSWEKAISMLSTEEKAEMLMNLFKYGKGEEPTLNTSGLKLVWAGMEFLLDKDSTKYQEAVTRGKNAALKRQSAVPQKITTAPTINLRHGIDNDNVNDNVNVNDNGNDNGNGDGDGGGTMEMSSTWEQDKMNQLMNMKALLNY
tara:strand:+ start:22 stop:480 length:459 start_codon:yes stop_codon:yes gene_type:complete